MNWNIHHKTTHGNCELPVEFILLSAGRRRTPDQLGWRSTTISAGNGLMAIDVQGFLENSEEDPNRAEMEVLQGYLD